MTRYISKPFLILLSLVMLIFIGTVVLPDFLQTDWHKDIFTFIVIVIIVSTPLVLVYLKDKKASYKNIPKNFNSVIVGVLHSKNGKYRKILFYFVLINALVFFAENLISYFYHRGI